MAFSFTRTRNQLATLVLSNMGVLAAGGTFTTADGDIVYEAIDLRLKEAHKLGIFWRKVDKTPLSFTITANVASASASIDVLLPIAMHVVDGTTDVPVSIIGARKYAAIHNKAETGKPTSVIWEGGANFKFHPIPTANTTAKLTYEKFAEDSSAGAAVDLDVSMLRAFRDILRYDLGDFFGMPDATMIRWKVDSEQAERAIRKLGSERVDFSAVAVDGDMDYAPSDYPV